MSALITAQGHPTFIGSDEAWTAADIARMADEADNEGVRLVSLSDGRLGLEAPTPDDARAARAALESPD